MQWKKYCSFPQHFAMRATASHFVKIAPTLASTLVHEHASLIPDPKTFGQVIDMVSKGQPAPGKVLGSARTALLNGVSGMGAGLYHAGKFGMEAAAIVAKLAPSLAKFINSNLGLCTIMGAGFAGLTAALYKLRRDFNAHRTETQQGFNNVRRDIAQVDSRVVQVGMQVSEVHRELFALRDDERERWAQLARDLANSERQQEVLVERQELMIGLQRIQNNRLDAFEALSAENFEQATRNLTRVGLIAEKTKKAVKNLRATTAAGFADAHASVVQVGKKVEDVHGQVTHLEDIVTTHHAATLIQHAQTQQQLTDVQGEIGNVAMSQNDMKASLEAMAKKQQELQDAQCVTTLLVGETGEKAGIINSKLDDLFDRMKRNEEVPQEELRYLRAQQDELFATLAASKTQQDVTAQMVAAMYTKIMGDPVIQPLPAVTSNVSEMQDAATSSPRGRSPAASSSPSLSSSRSSSPQSEPLSSSSSSLLTLSPSRSRSISPSMMPRPTERTSLSLPSTILPVNHGWKASTRPVEPSLPALSGQFQGPAFTSSTELSPFNSSAFSLWNDASSGQHERLRLQ